jgi:hypothetical protein
MKMEIGILLVAAALAGTAVRAQQPDVPPNRRNPGLTNRHDPAYTNRNGQGLTNRFGTNLPPFTNRFGSNRPGDRRIPTLPPGSPPDDRPAQPPGALPPAKPFPPPEPVPPKPRPQ